MRIGISIDTSGTLDDVLPRFATAEADGFKGAWVSNIFGYDAMTAPGPTRLAMKFKTKILPIACLRTGPVAHGEPPVSLAEAGRELALFPEWCVQREFGITWTEKQQARWQGVCDTLVSSALAQPVVAVHRDYMPRNLMVAEPIENSPGVLDFQDAMYGDRKSVV